MATHQVAQLPLTTAPLRARLRRSRLRVLLFLAPGLVGFAVFLVYPLVMTVWLSFTNSNMISQAQFVGLRNYRYLLDGDPQIWHAIRNTGWLVAVMVPAQVLFALGVAMVTARLKAGASLFRTLFYLPALAPPVAATVAFVCMFNPNSGPVNRILGLLGIHGPLWFNSPGWSKPALTLLALWGSGTMMVIFLAALLEVPAELYEAAELDGASLLQRVRYVTIPQTRFVILMLMLLQIIATMQVFTEPFVITGGGPESATVTVLYLIYKYAFLYNDFGGACALSVMLLVLLGVFSALYLRLTRSGEDDL